MLDLISNDSGPTRLPITQIRRDGGTQPRQGMDEDAVNDYANALRNGERLPAVDVMFDGSVYWLFDGFHRTEAHLRAGLTDIAVTIHQGTLEDAQWRSFGANKGHGLRRSNADKERAVRAALRHSTGAGLSNVQIAKHVGVDDKTVARYRAEMEATSEIPRLETRTGADGRERKAPPAPAACPPLPTLTAAVRAWRDGFTDHLGRDAVTVLHATRHANAPSRADLEKVLTAQGMTWKRQDLVQIIDNLRISVEAEAEQERRNVTQQPPPSPAPAPMPPSPAGAAAVPPSAPVTPTIPANLEGAGWALLRVGGEGNYYCLNRTLSKATATHEDASRAIAEAYTMQSELLRVQGPVQPGAQPVAVSEAGRWPRGSVQKLLDDFWVLLDKVVAQAEDTLWIDEFTTAHEALCELADVYDPAIAAEFRERLEE